MTEAETGVTQGQAEHRQAEPGATRSWERGLECTLLQSPWRGPALPAARCGPPAS